METRNYNCGYDLRVPDIKNNSFSILYNIKKQPIMQFRMVKISLFFKF